MRAVTVDSLVSAGLEVTFDAFIGRIDAWWIRSAEGTTIVFGPSAIVERFADGSERTVAEVRRVDRPHDLELTMDGDRVHVQFRAIDPSRTRVRVVHERSGDLTAFQDPVGVRWADRLGRFRAVWDSPTS